MKLLLDAQVNILVSRHARKPDNVHISAWGSLCITVKVIPNCIANKACANPTIWKAALSDNL